MRQRPSIWALLRATDVISRCICIMHNASIIHTSSFSYIMDPVLVCYTLHFLSTVVLCCTVTLHRNMKTYQ